MTAYILMGVSGSGKSTIGRLVADDLSLPFIEGDDFHPPANIAKMASGRPLTDDDRLPWIDALTEAINKCPSFDVVVACSALTSLVRDRLKSKIDRPLRFLYLQADAGVLTQRLQNRSHFMKPNMLPSQLAALEVPVNAMEIDATQPIESVVKEVTEFIRNGARVPDP